MVSRRGAAKMLDGPLLARWLAAAFALTLLLAALHPSAALARVGASAARRAGQAGRAEAGAGARRATQVRGARSPG